MNRSLVRAGVLFVGVVVAAGALSGCAPAHSGGSKHHAGSGNPPGTTTHVSPTATSTPTPTPTGLGPLPNNALFRITAVASQPNGAKVDLVQTVYAPGAPTIADTNLLNAQCNFAGDSTKWQSQFVGSLVYFTTEITATPRAGTPAWTTHDYDVGFGFGWDSSAYSGAYHGIEAPCASGDVTVPGAVHGVAAAVASNPTTGTGGWGSKNANYGFVGTGNNPNDPNFGGGTTIVGTCGIEISPVALAKVPALAAWKTQLPIPLNGCSYTP